MNSQELSGDRQPKKVCWGFSAFGSSLKISQAKTEPGSVRDIAAEFCDIARDPGLKGKNRTYDSSELDPQVPTAFGSSVKRGFYPVAAQDDVGIFAFVIRLH